MIKIDLTVKNPWIELVIILYEPSGIVCWLKAVDENMPTKRLDVQSAIGLHTMEKDHQSYCSRAF